MSKCKRDENNGMNITALKKDLIVRKKTKNEK